MPNALYSRLGKTSYIYLLHNGILPRQAGDYHTQYGVSNGSTVNLQGSRGSIGTNSMFSKKLQQDVWPRNCPQDEPWEEG